MEPKPIDRRTMLKLLAGSLVTVAAGEGGKFVEGLLKTDKQPSKESPKSEKLDPKVRTTEILIGDRTRQNWDNKKASGGENIDTFLGRHLDKINQIMQNTRETSGIKVLSMTGVPKVVNEDWLKNQSVITRQFQHSPDTVGRWSIDETYDPKNSSYLRDGIDYGLLHEWLHYSFYLYPHFYEVFTRSDSWFRYLTINIPGEQNIRTAEVTLWKEREMKKQMETRMLVDPQTQNNTYPLSEPEELYIKRMCLDQTSNNFSDVATPDYIDKLLTDDLAPEFRFSVPGDYKSAKLLIANAESFEQGDTLRPHNKFESPLEIPIINGEVVLPREFLSGAIKDASDPNKKYANAKSFILVLGEGEKRHLHGFTGWHLLYWTWKEQQNHGEKTLGSTSNQYPVNIDLSDFEI